MTARHTLVVLSLLLLVPVVAQPAASMAQSVFEKGGNIYFTDVQRHTIQLTKSGLDSPPAYLQMASSSCSSGTRQSRRYTPASVMSKHTKSGWSASMATTRSASCGERKTTPGRPRSPISTNHSFFRIAAGWLSRVGLAAVTDRVYLVDVKTGRVRPVTDGNDVEVVRDGKYRDHLIMSEHRYCSDIAVCGSIDLYWLVTPQGKEVGPIGIDELSKANFRAAYGRAATVDGTAVPFQWACEDARDASGPPGQVENARHTPSRQ